MTNVLERTKNVEYSPPALEPLGTLRSLTKGAGPGGMPIVMQTGGIPGGFGAGSTGGDAPAITT